MSKKKHEPLYARVRDILESARSNAARSVNTAQVISNWLVGREIVEEEQAGKIRAGYGESLMTDLSARLTRDFGAGWSVRQLEYMRSFYIEYDCLLATPKSNAVRSKFLTENSRTLQRHSWKPGNFNPNLSWTHYRMLLRVEKRPAGDNPTLGLILCTDKNDAVVKYTLGRNHENKIFASRYKLHVPSEAELKAEMRRELRLLSARKNNG